MWYVIANGHKIGIPYLTMKEALDEVFRLSYGGPDGKGTRLITYDVMYEA